MTKLIVAFTIDSHLSMQIDKMVEGGKYRNRSHLAEEAIIKLLREEIDNEKSNISRSG